MVKNAMSDPINIKDLNFMEKFIAKYCDNDCNGILEEKNAYGVNEINIFNSTMKNFYSTKNNSIFRTNEVAPNDVTYVAPKYVDPSKLSEINKIEEDKKAVKLLSLKFSLNTSTEYREYNPEVLEKALDNILKDNSKLKGTAKDFIEKGKQYNVDPLILIAISMHESARGLSTPAALMRNNIGGICDNEKTRKKHKWVSKTFDSVQDCIDTMAQTLSSYAKNGRTTIKDLPPLKPGGKGYCEYSARDKWISKIISFAKEVSNSYNKVIEDESM